MENISNIRFKGFTDDWEQRKVRCFINEGIIEAPMDGNHGEKHPTASEYVSDGIPFLMASDIHNGKADVYHCKYITKERASKLDKGVARNGDVLITHKATIGEIAILQDLKTEYAVLTPQVTYYRIKDESRLNQKYLYAYFNSEEFQNDLKTKAAQSTRPYIGISAQQNLTIKFPISVREQKQIGIFFANIDHFITLHQRKCDETKELKKYMLQKMFPQNGKKIPEIRFVGFTDDWEQRKLGEVADIVGGGTPSTSNSEYWDGDIDWYAPAEIADQSYVNSSARKITYKGYENSSAKMLPVGTVLFTSRAGIGKTAILAKEGCTNQGFQSIVPHKKELDSYFIFSRTEELKRYGETKGAGSTFVEVSGKQMANMELMMPKTLEEQQKIGAYFSNIDHLITLHQCKCDELKEVKKFMLQNMFPQKG